MAHLDQLLGKFGGRIKNIRGRIKKIRGRIKKIGGRINRINHGMIGM